MLISTAYAASEVASTGGSAWEAFMLNMLLIVILVVMFYVLLIMPQQKRFKKHREMINQLKKGDSVITAGGLIGKVHKVVDDKDEMIIELADGVRVTAIRSTIQRKAEV